MYEKEREREKERFQVVVAMHMFRVAVHVFWHLLLIFKLIMRAFKRKCPWGGSWKNQISLIYIVKKKRRYGNKFLDPRMLVMVIWLWFLYYMYMVFSVHKTVWCIFIHVHKVFYIISSVREKLRSQNHIIFLKIPLSL